jgi:[NiFe] hydrogenase assembly HybE family chaperone
MTDTLPDPSRRLTAAFEAIAPRMRDLGFYNPALRVEAVDFEPWEGRWLGVMVTPWFVNLMLLPCEPQRWESLAPGTKRRYRFPAGDYEFIGALDDALGNYQMCSLFSPALEFADHDMARLVAQLARRALFDSANAPRPEAEHGVALGGERPGPLAHAITHADAPLSKREFLRGRFLQEKRDEPRS